MIEPEKEEEQNKNKNKKKKRRKPRFGSCFLKQFHRLQFPRGRGAAEHKEKQHVPPLARRDSRP